MSRIVETSRAVSATRSRKAKIEQIGALLAEADVGDIEPAVSWLSGELPQGRIGVGWRTLADLDVAAAADSTLTVAEVDEAITSVAATSGAGSAARRVALLTDLFSRSTPEE
ncbi:MAG: ATP-dependent DNA ligase, partial [Rhodococcus sp. (in: high G+C Gram-positive bacteria)]